MTEREALKLALEALEVATTPLAKDRQEVLRAQAAIREALAQPEQEPVAINKLSCECGAEWRFENSALEYTPAPQPKQKPAFYIVKMELEALQRDGRRAMVLYTKPITYGIEVPVYTTPPQRTWIGLTDEELQYAFRMNSVMVDNGNSYMVAGLRAVNIARAIEAKLKEKNT